MNAIPAQTPLHDWHATHDGRMVDFAGWSMPVQYTSIVEEHQATRTAAGLFDISHMGRIRFDGKDAGIFLDSLVTRSVAALPPGRIRYGLVTNESGGVKDDVLVVSFVEPRIVDEPVIQQIGEDLKSQVEAIRGGKMLLSFRGVQLMSSPMLAQIIELNKRCKDANVKLKLCQASSELESVFKVMRLHKLVKCFPDEAAALASFKKKGFFG